MEGGKHDRTERTIGATATHSPTTKNSTERTSGRGATERETTRPKAPLFTPPGQASIAAALHTRQNQARGVREGRATHTQTGRYKIDSTPHSQPASIATGTPHHKTTASSTTRVLAPLVPPTESNQPRRSRVGHAASVHTACRPLKTAPAAYPTLSPSRLARPDHLRQDLA